MNTKNFEITVLNVSDIDNKYKYVVVRLVDGTFWYYGADNDETRARNIAEKLGNAFVVENK